MGYFLRGKRFLKRFFTAMAKTSGIISVQGIETVAEKYGMKTFFGR
jgi:hypothetical protein